LKIALICTEKLPVPPISGGAVQLYIEGILPYLSSQNDITVFSVEHPDLPSREYGNGIRYVRVPGRTGIKYLEGIKSGLDSSYDLIHIFNRPRWVMPVSGLFPDSRISLSLHNEMFHPDKINEAEGLKCINRVEFINTVSRFIADGVKSRFPIAEKKLHVVYSGADINRYKPAWTAEGLMNKNRLKAMYGISNYRVVLYVGRLSGKKGTHVVLKAMKQVMDSYDDVALVVIGSKWYGKNEMDEYTLSLQKIAKDLRGPIVFTGFLPPSQVYSHYNIADMFVCASQWQEPLARVHYEAMAAGVPIITTNRGGNAEVVSGLGNGIVIDDYYNPDSFAKNIVFLLKDPSSAAQMGKNGRMLAEKVYNWERVAKEVFAPMAQWKKEPVNVNYKPKSDGTPSTNPLSSDSSSGNTTFEDMKARTEEQQAGGFFTEEF